MARIFEQLNFYDIFGYLMPGAVVAGCALLLVDAAFPDVAVDLGATSAGEWVGLVFLAYLAGHIVQAVARHVEQAINRVRWGGWPSDAFLRPDNHRFTPEFKDSLRKVIGDQYALPETAFSREAFAICYSYVIQKGIRRRVEPFLGLCGLSRGMIVASAIAALLLAGGAAAHAVHGDATKDIALFAAGAAAALLAALVFVERLADFSERFAEAVYRDFYVAHKGGTAEGVKTGGG
jgi:hypothetical protein